MNLLEYEAKRWIAAGGIAVPKAREITRACDAGNLVVPVVLKSQVPVGGRGKAGGVRLVKDTKQLTHEAGEIFDLSIKGHKPRVLLAEEMISIKHEFYLSLLIDREEAGIKLLAFKNGGVEVENQDGEPFTRMITSVTPALSDELADYYDRPEKAFLLEDLLAKMYSCFRENDASLIEINPLVLTESGDFIAADCKMTLDDAATFRHPDWDFTEQGASAQFALLNPRGNIATMANGAGLAMATVDAVTAAGLSPVNFLDVGGGSSAASMFSAFENILSQSQPRAILINIVAGITRCDEVAEAIITAREKIPALPPLFIRLIGNNMEQGRRILEKHGVQVYDSFSDCLRAAKEEVL